jgi:hypothetical protein
MYVPLLQQEDCMPELCEWRAGSLSRDIVFIWGYSPYRLFAQSCGSGPDYVDQKKGVAKPYTVCLRGSVT